MSGHVKTSSEPQNPGPACFVASSPDNAENNLNYSVSFDPTDKSNTSFESVKGLLLFVYTHNNNKTLCFCKIKKTDRVCSLSSLSPLFTDTK